MALSFLLAAKQIGKYNRQWKQIVQLNKNKYKPSINTKKCNNLLQPHQTANNLVGLHETNKIFIQPKGDASNYVNLNQTASNLPRLPEFLARSEIYCVEIFVKKRRFHTSASERKFSAENGSQRETPPLPRIVYMQNPFTWIINKFDMKILEKAWDPTFNQTEFVRGSKQAVSTVMQLVTEGNNDDLRGLLTKAAHATLQGDLEQPGVEGVRKLMAINPSDIKVAAPRRVRFLKYEDRKFCDVDMMFVALKWVSPEGSDGLIYLELFASFRREYTQYSIPEWTIAYFKIIKINVLDR